MNLICKFQDNTQIGNNFLKMLDIQTTIERPSSCFGVGAHSGRKTQVTLKPAPANTGIVFIRSDVKDVTNVLQAHFSCISDTSMATTISNDAKVKVSTIEHLMAALYGCGIDNVIVEVDGEEVPIMDGSSKPFIFMIECAGIQMLGAPRKKLQILKELSVEHNGSKIIASPSDEFSIDVNIEFPSKVIGKQSMSLNNIDAFKEEIGSARTFGFMRDLEYLRSRGLAKGSSLENAIGINDKDEIENKEGLRYENEFARHKLLDSVGDFYCAGAQILGHFECTKQGHALNHQMLLKIFSDPNNYRFV